MPDNNPPSRKPIRSVDRPCDGCHRPMIGIISGPMKPPRTECQECEYQADAAQSRQG